MTPPPPAPWPSYDEEQVQAAADVLRSGRVNAWTGGEIRAFEAAFARFAGTAHAIALANGTLALDLALHGLGIGARNGGAASDEVVVTPRSFVASASAIVNAGARPVFADVDRDSQNITPATVAAVITPRTRAVLCVHLAGWPCDMDGMRRVAGPEIRLIEDCAQAHGARYRGRPVGSLGDVAAWSFCQDKIMTTGGEGGMVTCDDPALWRRMWSFKDHGKDWDAVHSDAHPPGFRWLHHDIGTNWRLTEMQAAIGQVQLRRMPDWHAARARNAGALLDALARYPGALRVPRLSCDQCLTRGETPDQGCTHAWYRAYAFVRPEGLAPGWDRDRIAAEISARGVICQQGSCPEIYRERALAGFAPPARLPVAQQLGETSLMFLCHPTLAQAHLDHAARAISQVMAEAAA